MEAEIRAEELSTMMEKSQNYHNHQNKIAELGTVYSI